MLKVHYPQFVGPDDPYLSKANDLASRTFELGIKQQSQDLLASINGLTLMEMKNAEVCCGFGGTFCVKYPEIFTKMVSDKTRHIEASGADLLLADDLGCPINMAGRLRRRGCTTEARHVAEMLAGELNAPAIGTGPHDRPSDR